MFKSLISISLKILLLLQFFQSTAVSNCYDFWDSSYIQLDQFPNTLNLMSLEYWLSVSLIFLKKFLLIILYKFSLYIRYATLAYTVNKYTPALWLRSIGLPWRMVSRQLHSGYLCHPRSWPPPGNTGKLQAPRGPSQASCVGAKNSMHRAPCLGAEQLYSLGQQRSMPHYLGQNHGPGKESSSWGKMSHNAQAPVPRVGLKTDGQGDASSIVTWLGKLQPLGQICPDTYFCKYSFIGKHPHSFMWYLCFHTTKEELWQRLCGLQSLKYLLSDPLRKHLPTCELPNTPCLANFPG